MQIFRLMPAVLVLAVAGLVSTCGRPHAPAPVAAARQALAAEQTQDGLDRAAARAGDRASANTLRTLAAAEEAIRDVQTSPGAGAPLDPDLLARFDAGVDRVWAPDLAAAGGSAGADSGDHRRTVPAAGQGGSADGR